MKSILEFDSIELSFDTRRILSGIYMQCQQGEVVGLLGRNGSGKSSMMKVVFGVLNADHKSVRIDDVALQGDYIQRRLLAYLPQDKLIPSYISVRTAFHLFKVNVDEIISVVPEVNEFLTFKPYELSGGWQRLIEVLLILYSPAPFCMLDEPFTGLMPIHIETLTTVIADCKKKKGIIISDHMHRHVTALSDRLYLLANGRTYEIKEKERLVELGYLKEV